jgi:hypothetical protein
MCLCVFRRLKVDVYSMKHQRDDRDLMAEWENERRKLTDSYAPPKELFTISAFSPPCLAWILLSAAAMRNTIVDEFHNIAEGPACLFCAVFLCMLADTVLHALKRRWSDRTLWAPHAQYPAKCYGSGHKHEGSGQGGRSSSQAR